MLNYTIPGLTSGTYYELLMYATNTIGSSEESSLIIGKTTGTPDECYTHNIGCNNIEAIIVGILFGIIIIVLVAYAGYVTLLLKRKGENKDGNVSSKTVRNLEPIYTNLAYTRNDNIERQPTDLDDSGDLQYTSLKTHLKDDKETYDVLNVVS